jgi:hypothetical protein
MQKNIKHTRNNFEKRMKQTWKSDELMNKNDKGLRESSFCLQVPHTLL